MLRLYLSILINEFVDSACRAIRLQYNTIHVSSQENPQTNIHRRVRDLNFRTDITTQHNQHTHPSVFLCCSTVGLQ